jgi:hypothetical protein
MEGIINCCNDIFVIKHCNSIGDEQLGEDDETVSCDGILRTVLQ